MKPGTVILDVDGTLVDSNDAHARAWVDAFAEAGITVPFDEVRRAIGMGGDKLMPAVSGIRDDSKKGRRISERRRQIFKERYFSEVRAFPGVRELVSRLLEDGFRLTVASSATADELELLLERAGVADLIRHQTSSDDAEGSKPEPDIVEAALARSGGSASHAFMLGDTPYDIEAGRNAGVAVVALESGGWSARELEGAIAIYRDPADLLGHYEESPFARIGDGDHVNA